MKYAILFLIAVFSVACSTQTVESQKINGNSQSANSAVQTKQPVLVELYTSEGCSSCPSADKTLAFLEKEQPYAQAEIITLALHVDYWNYLGWKDEFSSAAFSERQAEYADKLKIDSTYTPQMIVDGQTQFVGSDTGKAAAAITQAAKTQKALVEISAADETVKINISGIPKHENADVLLAITESGLSSSVRRGENSGKVLEHVSVVRELRKIGSINSSETKFSSAANVKIAPEWKKENVKIIAFVQEMETRKVLGVNRISVQ